MATTVVATRLGDVEIVDSPGRLAPVLHFPGGHCTAATPCGAGVYAGLGHRVVSFSRPGYGRTAVGRISAGQFVPAVLDVCAQLAGMSSQDGFVADLRQGRPAGRAEREAVLARVTCSTLVTGSSHDGGVAFHHSEDLAARIRGATLVDLGSPTHLFWLGPGRGRLDAVIRDFLDTGARGATHA